ncbi:MAG: DUF342 domain-containing protein [Bacillota bacterium]|nr:DUF342 domain-containing protein [Candidatus Fermentithermobacillaceae bacterium]
MQPVKVVISQNRMGAYVVLAPGREVTPEDIVRALKREGVTQGISPEALQEAISGDRGVKYQVAWGRVTPESLLESLPKPKLLFNYPESQGKPPEVLRVGPDFPSVWRRLMSRGIVNTGANLGFVRSAHTLPKAVTVTGDEVPFAGSGYEIKLGPNTRLSPDGLKVVSERPGIPYEDETGIGILDHITIVGDIGPKTGDISFPGDITVRGSIHAGFTVSTSSSLLIGGNLWGSATARGKIVVSGGITAPGELIESGQGIACKFCENSVIRSSGPIEVETALIHSVVETEHEVNVTGEGGRIVGGLVRAVTAITAGVVGSPMGVPTVLELGITPRLRRELSRLERELERVSSELSEMSKIAGVRAHVSPMDRIRLLRGKRLLQEREKAIRERLYLLRKNLSDSPKGYFQGDRVLPGTRLVMGMDVHEFTSPIDKIIMGARRA